MEIGGFLGLETRYRGMERYPNLIALNTGRNALLYLIRAKHISRILIPYFLCNCIKEVCQKNGTDIVYYHIDKDFLPILERDLYDDEFLYCVNYYGVVSRKVFATLKLRYKRVIIDNAHAFFEPPLEKVDTIYTCRKFLGVSDGAYLQTDTLLNGSLEKDISVNRMKHLLGRIDVSAERYYQEYIKCENLLSKVPLREMSSLTHQILKGVEYGKIIKKRKENYKMLNDSLKHSNHLELKHTPYAPYAYPYYCEGGMDIRRKLAAHKIYIPTLWPNVVDCAEASELERDYAANILPLPCDQRYESREMNILLEEIKNVQRNNCTENY